MSGAIEGWLPGSSTIPFLKLDETQSYIGSGLDGSGTAFVATPDMLFLVKDSVPRIGVADSGESFVRSSDLTSKVEVNDAGVVVAVQDKPRIQASTYGTLVSGGGQSLAGVTCNMNLDGDIFFNRDPVGTGVLPIFYARSSGLELCSTDNSVLLHLANGQGVRVNNSYTLPSTDGLSGQVLSTNGLGQLSWVSI